jgi:hypothetical protein
MSNSTKFFNQQGIRGKTNRHCEFRRRSGCCRNKTILICSLIKLYEETPEMIKSILNRNELKLSSFDCQVDMLKGNHATPIKSRWHDKYFTAPPLSPPHHYTNDILRCTLHQH